VHLAGQSDVQTRRLAEGPLGARPGRPGGDGLLEVFTVHDDVEPLVEECDEAADLRSVVLRLLVGPGDVGDGAVAGCGRPVDRLPL